jgi:hypothetical protein
VTVLAPTAEDLRDVLTRFSQKRASFSTILPTVAGPILGGTLGTVLGERMGARLGRSLMLPSQVAGTILGTTAGRALAEREPSQFQPTQQPNIPSGAPFAIDPTVAADDIPPWALMGARILRSQKMGAFLSPEDRDIMLGELPPYAMYEGYRHGGGKGLLKGLAAEGIGGVAGAGLGLLAGKGLGKLVGQDYRLPWVNVPVSHLLAGMGGTIGMSKAMQYALPGRH